MIKKIRERALIFMYIIGSLITAALVFIYLYPANYQESQAMLGPSDQAVLCLAVGCIPMLVVSIKFFSLTIKKEMKKLKRNLLFLLIMLPAIICAVPFVALAFALIAAYVKILIIQQS
jgi:hypothetical protein